MKNKKLEWLFALILINPSSRHAVKFIYANDTDGFLSWVSLLRIAPWKRCLFPLLHQSHIRSSRQGWGSCWATGITFHFSLPSPTFEPLCHMPLIIHSSVRSHRKGKLNSTLSSLFLVHRIEERNVGKDKVWALPWRHSLKLPTLLTTHRVQCTMHMHKMLGHGNMHLPRTAGKNACFIFRVGKQC